MFALNVLPKTLWLIKDENQRANFRRLYKILGLAMLGSPAAAFVLNVLARRHEALVFYVEAAGIFAFAAYWLTKSREISLTQAEKKAIKGELEISNLAQPDGQRKAAAAG